MKNGDHDDTLFLGICAAAVLLFALIGGIVESTLGKETPLWTVFSVLALLPGVIIGIHMIVTKRAFYKRSEIEGPGAIAFGVLFLLVFVAAIFCLIGGALTGSP